MITVRCPKCGSADIRERNTAYAELPVLGWTWDDEEKVLTPESYDTDVSVDWECADECDAYVCHGCRWSGEPSDLAVFEIVAAD